MLLSSAASYGSPRVDFLKSIIMCYSGDTRFLCVERKEKPMGDKGHVRNETRWFLHST